MQFEEIYNQYSQKIYRVCMGFMNDHDKAKDLTQETFIAVWQHLPSFRNEANISTWIFRIATNNCLRTIERSKKIKTSELPFELPYTEQENIEDKLRFLYKCISELEEIDRIIISLVLEDIPQAEIAGIVGLSEVNTRVKIHRVKEKISKKFKSHGQFQ
jgi:RNA polymerase sigma-70 factor (ECF subfamily)